MTSSQSMSASDRTDIVGYLDSAKRDLLRAMNAAGPHSRRLVKQLDKLISGVEVAQGTANRLRVTP